MGGAGFLKMTAKEVLGGFMPAVRKLNEDERRDRRERAARKRQEREERYQTTLDLTNA